jgi:hypothetical protein
MDPDSGREIHLDRHYHRLDPDAGGTITLVEHTSVRFGSPRKDKRTGTQEKKRLKD